MLRRIKNKMSRIEEYVAFLKEIVPDCNKKIKKDRLYQGAVLHYLYLVADCSVTIAEMVIKYKQFQSPESYADAIDILGDKKVIPSEFAYNFARIASFRNFLAHDYDKINFDSICEFAQNNLDEVLEYIKYIKASLKI
jgi:uncharacterized protein YutE (UPF0331/DUF86 family)